MGTNIRMAGRGVLAAATLAGLACLGLAVPAPPAMGSSVTAPQIHSLSPRAGAAGTKVTITGSGFSRVTAVRFRGVAAAFRVRSASRITAAVPAMPSAAGRVTVTTRAGTATSRARFTVTPRIVLSPVTGPPGSVVAVSGTGFGATEGADIFVGTTDRALAGTGLAGSFGPIRVTIPASTAPGTAWISAEGRHTRLFAQAAFTVNTDWPQFGFSAAHTGSNPFENVLSGADVARLGLDWSFRTGGIVDSSPAVANGVVYVASTDDHMYALNAATGATRWTFHTTLANLSSPAVANGLVYIGSVNGPVNALNAATGATRWTFTTGNLDVEHAPAVAGGVVYVGSFSGHVYALNAATGARRWTFRTGAFIDSSPAVANGVVYIGDLNGTVYAINAATGAELWTFTTGNAVFSSPAVANGVVYISAGGHVHALNAATGAELWTFTAGSFIDSSPAVANGVLYIGSNDGHVYALDAATGAELWTYTTAVGASSPAVANGVVYIGSDDDHVYALNAATGAELWTYTTGSLVDSSPAVANGVVYIGSEDGNAYAFGLPGGLTTPARPNRNSLHPDYNLPQQR